MFAKRLLPPHARRSTRLAIVLLALATLGSAPEAMAVPTPAVAVDSIGITVNDMDRAMQFYSQVLSFVTESDREVAGDAYEHLYGVFGLRLRVVRMRLGTEHIELMQFLAPHGRPSPADTHSNDRWFQHIAIIVSDMDRAYARLRQFHVEHASSGPQRLPDWNPDAGGIKAFYFRDPDGNFLEVLQFPADKGAARWHQQASGEAPLFLGIDHTAIVVSDTEASLRFYRDALGMQVAGGADNYGTEQEHLNNVFGAHLRITALRAAQGPGVEFLEYLAPRTGRPMPPDTSATDDWYWQINLRADDPVTLARQLKLDLTVTAGGELGIARGAVVHDPDGHATLLYQPAH
jgi:catechol 2,3-dioxygenase-like lactoylglutathione lyase family enzyme